MGENFQVLSFEGIQTIEKAASIKDLLVKAFKGKKKEILFDFSRVEKVDLSFFQLLHAAGTEAGNSGKTLSITGKVPEILISSVRLAGFDKNLSGDGGVLFRQMIAGGGTDD